MANRIKGITVEIGGDTTGLDKALKSVNSSITKTQSALNDVNRLLKLDPSNTVLVAQKQELLAQAISQTEEKLSALEAAQEQVVAAFARGDIGADKYQAFQREIEETRGKLNKYKADLSDLQTEQDALSQNTARLEKLFAATGTEVDDYADVLGSRLTSAIKNGTANSDQLRTALEKIGKSATGGKADIRQLTDALDTVDDGQAIQNLIQQLNEAGDAAENTADDVGQIAENTKGAALMQAADQLSAVGDKIQEIGDKALDAYSDTENAVTKVNAYFGETGKAAEQSASVIKNVYSSGVGESMDAVANAVLMVKKNLGDLSETDLTNLTQQAITLEELYGIDMNETLRGVNSLMQQYGLTAQEAMDYIVVGTQNGLDKTNELGDNLSEYAGKFAQAGYSASEYFQLLDNGLKNGAYNLDKVNDAINEVTTRLVDGTIGESIGMFSTKTQELFTSWQNGGATQKQVIDSIVADIAGCTNQQEALNLAALAFGTMAEDGNLKFITSLTSVGSTYDSVKGSAQGLFDATTTPMQEMESNTRKLQQSLVPLGEKLAEIANTILPPLVSVIQTVSNWFQQLPEPVQNFIVILGALLAAFTALTPVIAALAVSVGALNISLLPIIAVIAAVAAAIAGIIAIIQNWGAITEWFGNLWNTICTGIGTMIESVKTWFSNLWTHLQNVWNGICNVVQTAVMLLGSIIQGAVDIITLPFRFIWENCKDIVTSVWNGIKDTVSSVLSAISGVISSIMGAIQNVISSIWNAISSKVSAVVNAIKNTVTSVFNAIKSVASSVWNGVKSVISTVVDGIKSKVSSVFNAVKSTVTSVFNGIKSTATTVWNGIKTAITKPIEAAKNTIKGIVDKISGFFSGMKLELPKIKLPHFKITGKLSLAPPSVPHLSIDWYKEGGTCTITCTTYNGNTNIGSKTCTLTVSVPASVKPTISSLTASRIDGEVPSTWGIYVQTKSKVKLTINGAAGSNGSTIKSYSITGGGYSGSASTLTTGFLNNSGTITFKATVTDSRGRVSAEASVSITVTAYSPPYFNSSLSQRCLSNGTLDDDGTYIHAMVSFGYSTCSGKNTLKTSVQYKQVSAEQWTDARVTFASNTAFTYGKGQISTETSYDVRYTLEDAFSTISVQEIVSTAAVVMDFKSGGKGVAIGKVSERDNTFEVAENWDVKVYGMLLKEYIQQFAKTMYPVGSIYMSTKSTNPSTYFGGTWVAWGSGRVPVGINTSDSNFNTVEKTGGASTVALTTAQMPSHSHAKGSLATASAGAHTHNIQNQKAAWGTNSGNRVLIDATSGYTAVTNKTTTSGGAHTHTISGSTAAAGSGNAHNNLQPYIVCYMWKRTA